jgi:mannose PTS system EIIA component
MIGILVISHEPLGTALIRCTRHIFGRLPAQLAALDVIPDEDVLAATQAARDLLARINDGSGVLVLTDVFGATPSRIAMSLAEPYRICVVAGVNLPLLVKALSDRRLPLEELVDQLIARGRDAIFAVSPPGETQTVTPEEPEASGPSAPSSGAPPVQPSSARA